LKREVQIPRLYNKLSSPCRLSRDQLIQKSILCSYGNPSILRFRIRQGLYINGENGVLLFQSQRILEKHLKYKFLKEKLLKRTGFEQDLVQSGVLKEASNVMPWNGYNSLLFPTQIELLKQFNGIKLKQKLQNRPSAEQITVLQNSDQAFMVCPSVRSKILFFEGLNQNAPTA